MFQGWLAECAQVRQAERDSLDVHAPDFQSKYAAKQAAATTLLTLTEGSVLDMVERWLSGQEKTNA